LKGEDTLQGDIIRIYLRENALSAEGNTVTYVTTVASDPFTIRADTQQFDNTTKNVVARGAVVVNYKETKAFSPRAILQVGPSGKAEKVVFSGGARIEKDNSQITGEKVTVMVGTGNMIAEQNVKTQVDLKDPKGGSPTRVLIDSDYQQYDKASETVLASGNVRIVYDTYIATGPKATFKMKDGTVEQIFLTGRPSIIENDRKIVADKITITTNPKHFDAFGNVKTQFQAQKNGEPITAEPGPSAPAPSSGKPATAKPGKAPAKGGKKPAAKPKSSLPQPEPDLIEE
jgi:lipopolysaccharide export system protein LptA